MNIKQIRERFGISQAELARRAELPQGTLSVYESTCRIIKNPKPEYMTRIAAVLNTTVSALLDTDERLVRKKEEPLKRKRCLNQVCLLNKRKRCINEVVLSDIAPCYGQDRISEPPTPLTFNGEGESFNYGHK